MSKFSTTSGFMDLSRKIFDSCHDALLLSQWRQGDFEGEKKVLFKSIPCKWRAARTVLIYPKYDLGQAKPVAEKIKVNPFRYGNKRREFS